jgi:hypothetical protein
MFSRKCPKCDKEMTYSTKTNLNRAIRKNAVCKSCAMLARGPETRAKMSESRKKMLNERSEEEKARIVAKMAATLRSNWENKTEEEVDAWREVCSRTSKARWTDENYKNRVAVAVKNSWDNLTDNEREERVTKSLDNGAGRCEYFDQKGYRVQGMTEKRFVDYFLNNDDLKDPLKKRPKAIRTPMGLYYPDFITDDGLVYEVKSLWTFNKLKTKKGEAQLEKMKWINDNLKEKKVVLFVEQKNKDFSIIEDLSNV